MYEITDYDKLYRPYDKSGGELKHPGFVKLPVKPKGDGLQLLLDQKRGLEVFAIWCLLLEKATSERPKNRGKLLNHKEEPATPDEIARGISLKTKVGLVEYALNTLVTIGWLVSSEQIEQSSAKVPPNITKDKLIKDKSNIIVVFEKWNTFKGKNWKSHVKLSYEIEQAITEQLKHYSVDDLSGAIENYARVLLGSDFKWSYAWTLQQFLTRTSPTNRKEQQLWRFLPNNYHDEDYLYESTLKRRVKERKQWYEGIRDCEEQKLIEAYRENKNNLNWLIDEIRPEIKGRANGL